MKNYVVGIVSLFDNELKLFPVIAESEYEAVKKAMVDFAGSDDAKKHELDWQNSESYPKDIAGLVDVYEEIPFEVLEVGSFAS